MSLTHAEWVKLRDMINAWPDDGDRIIMHRVINREKLVCHYTHNHITRDIKKKGAGCPACDFYRDNSTVAACQLEFEQRPGVSVRCDLTDGHEGDCAIVCKPCGYIVPRGSDGWHNHLIP